MPAENMYIGLRAKEGLRFPYFLDERMPENPLEIFPKEGWTGYILDTGKRYCLSLDAPPPETAKPVGALPQDWLGVPILDRDRSPMGVLTVQTYRAHESYTASDVEFLEFTAEALSVAIQLADQDREIAIHRIAALVEETVDVTDLYPKIHEILQTIIPAARKNLIISRVDESAGVFIPVFWRDEKDELATSPWPLSHGMSGYIYRTSHASFIYEDGITPVPPGIINFGSFPKYWLGAPLFNRDKILGIVVVQTYDSSEVITREDEFAINGICPYIASAISHAELFSRVKGM
jgi:GAF domain-containing protein